MYCPLDLERVVPAMDGNAQVFLRTLFDPRGRIILALHDSPILRPLLTGRLENLRRGSAGLIFI